jgi:hypothetical protein
LGEIYAHAGYSTNFHFKLQAKKMLLFEMPAYIALVACLKQAQKNKGCEKGKSFSFDTLQ